MTYTKLGAKRRTRYPKRVPRKNKRWSVAVGGSYSNPLFGQASGNIRFNSRAFKSAVKKVVNTSGAPLHVLASPAATGMTHDTLYTLPIFQNIIKSTTDTGAGLRAADQIKPLSLHIKGAFECPASAQYSIFEFKIVSLDGDYLSASGNTWQSGVGTSDMFKSGTTAHGLPLAINDPKKCKVMFHRTITIRPQSTATVTAKNFDFYFKFAPNFTYKYLTGSNYGEKNVYAVCNAFISNGTGGTTVAGYLHNNIDFCYLDNA